MEATFEVTLTGPELEALLEFAGLLGYGDYPDDIEISGETAMAKLAEAFTVMESTGA